MPSDVYIRQYHMGEFEAKITI